MATSLCVEHSVISTANTDHPQQCEHACTDIFEQWLSEEEEKLEEAPVLEPVVVFPLCVMFHELVGIGTVQCIHS